MTAATSAASGRVGRELEARYLRGATSPTAAHRPAGVVCLFPRNASALTHAPTRLRIAPLPSLPVNGTREQIVSSDLHAVKQGQPVIMALSGATGRLGVTCPRAVRPSVEGCESLLKASSATATTRLLATAELPSLARSRQVTRRKRCFWEIRPSL